MKPALERKIDPGKVFDLTPPLADVAEGYRAMDERRAIKVLPRVRGVGEAEQVSSAAIPRPNSVQAAHLRYGTFMRSRLA